MCISGQRVSCVYFIHFDVTTRAWPRDLHKISVSHTHTETNTYSPFYAQVEGPNNGFFTVHRGTVAGETIEGALSTIKEISLPPGAALPLTYDAHADFEVRLLIYRDDDVCVCVCYMQVI